MFICVFMIKSIQNYVFSDIECIYHCNLSNVNVRASNVVHRSTKGAEQTAMRLIQRCKGLQCVVNTSSVSGRHSSEIAVERSPAEKLPCVLLNPFIHYAMLSSSNSCFRNTQ